MTLTDPLISRIAAGLVATGGYLTALAHQLCAPKAAALSQPAERNVIMIDPSPLAVPADPAPLADPAPAPADAVPPAAPIPPTLGDLAMQLAAAREEYRDAHSQDAQATLAARAAAQAKADAYATLVAARDAFAKASADLAAQAAEALALDATPVES